MTFYDIRNGNKWFISAQVPVYMIFAGFSPSEAPGQEPQFHPNPEKFNAI